VHHHFSKIAALHRSGRKKLDLVITCHHRRACAAVLAMPSEAPGSGEENPAGPQPGEEQA
jgi:hypothetical protein